ncbi:hypothetical protein [Streptomyces sp. H34-S4]|uniref:hypothetical protein n=1 Tax=Streptomyces sp. H34-S4 TaxID=2996463 RepID=UPI00226F96C3|nr:hypothetical protein [Streptomyces sp. H34-S4]MCY0935559.1 hypothetical protein [Streptomyces sp. H34-S4]
MTIPPSPEDPARETRLRRAGIAAFLAGTAASFAFFAFFPGLPHIIDWGAILTSLAVGALTRWAWRSHIRKKAARLG